MSHKWDDQVPLEGMAQTVVNYVDTALRRIPLLEARVRFLEAGSSLAPVEALVERWLTRMDDYGADTRTGGTFGQCADELRVALAKARKLAEPPDLER